VSLRLIEFYEHVWVQKKSADAKIKQRNLFINTLNASKKWIVEWKSTSFSIRREIFLEINCFQALEIELHLHFMITHFSLDDVNCFLKTEKRKLGESNMTNDFILFMQNICRERRTLKRL
jgi:hypothetical protein